VNILFLLTDAYGSLGGISQFNRDFLGALDASSFVTRIQAVPRIIPDAIEDKIPEAVVFDRKGVGGKVRFTLRAIEHARSDVAVDLVICGHVNLLPAAVAVACMRGARLALILHGIEAWQPTHDHLVNWLTGFVDAFLAVSRLTAKRFRNWSGALEERFTVVPNCVNLERFVPQPPDPQLVARYRLEGCKVILTFGRLAGKERAKGFDRVLDVLPNLVCQNPDLKYLIVGDGDDRSRLAAKADTLGVGKNVVFAGRIPEEEKVAHFNLADVYAMPSSGEGFGIVLLEAAACGIPVVGSNADGSEEALLGGQLGALVDPKNSNELTDTISHLLDRKSPKERPAGIETFGVNQFRIRVNEWLCSQSRTLCVKRGAA